ncbi:methyltransferase [Methylovorus sp. MM2]|uniref:prepilin peptidase n=1 Tax=Methylovorus sp. MM2 TaxID=1848038 RepID=UPI0007E15D8B|nr:A24 family peptidase [Methylovorus sp. MM2]OAM52378.1 methyltransferase [Methylovorus sp. MM2]
MPDFISNLLDVLREEPAFFITFSVVFGLMVGSFLNVVIHRLPKIMEREWRQSCAELQGEELPTEAKYNIVTPRSACPNCQHKITALENIPVFSYLLLKGKCRGCKTAISIRYPLIELLTGLLIGLISWKFGYSGMAVAAWIFTFALIALTFIDFDTQLLPDDITLPLLWLGLLFNLNTGFTDIHSSIIGAVAGYLSLWSVYWIFKIVTGKEGMGYGDFKLLAAIGAWFGWQLLPAVILLSSLAGSIIGIGLIVLAKQGRNVPMPFGPYLALGGIAALFFGPQLSQIYLGG